MPLGWKLLLLSWDSDIQGSFLPGRAEARAWSGCPTIPRQPVEQWEVLPFLHHLGQQRKEFLKPGEKKFKEWSWLQEKKVKLTLSQYSPVCDQNRLKTTRTTLCLLSLHCTANPMPFRFWAVVIQFSNRDNVPTYPTEPWGTASFFCSKYDQVSGGLVRQVFAFLINYQLSWTKLGKEEDSPYLVKKPREGRNILKGSENVPPEKQCCILPRLVYIYTYSLTRPQMTANYTQFVCTAFFFLLNTSCHCCMSVYTGLPYSFKNLFLI